MWGNTFSLNPSSASVFSKSEPLELKKVAHQDLISRAYLKPLVPLWLPNSLFQFQIQISFSFVLSLCRWVFSFVCGAALIWKPYWSLREDTTSRRHESLPSRPHSDHLLLPSSPWLSPLCSGSPQTPLPRWFSCSPPIMPRLISTKSTSSSDINSSTISILLETAERRQSRNKNRKTRSFWGSQRGSDRSLYSDADNKETVWREDTQNRTQQNTDWRPALWREGGRKWRGPTRWGCRPLLTSSFDAARKSLRFLESESNSVYIPSRLSWLHLNSLLITPKVRLPSSNSYAITVITLPGGQPFSPIKQRGPRKPVLLEHRMNQGRIRSIQ